MSYTLILPSFDPKTPPGVVALHDAFVPRCRCVGQLLRVVFAGCDGARVLRRRSVRAAEVMNIHQQFCRLNLVAPSFPSFSL